MPSKANLAAVHISITLYLPDHLTEEGRQQDYKENIAISST